MMSNLYVFSSRMLNWIFRDVDGTGIVLVDGKMLLTNTVIMEEFCIHRSWVQQLPAAMHSAFAVDKEIEFCFLLF